MVMKQSFLLVKNWAVGGRIPKQKWSGKQISLRTTACTLDVSGTVI